MMSLVYHGSYARIDEINLSLSQKGRDFGRGFYVTKIRFQAEQWATRKGKWRKTEGAVTEFWLHEELMRTLKLKVLHFEGYTKEWLDFVVLNRNNPSEQQAHDYDIVEGPVADDEVAQRISDYMRGDITKEQFLSELVYAKPSHQICFCTDFSLRVLVTQKDKVNRVFVHIDNQIVKSLMLDHGMDGAKALDVYYTSQTYALLTEQKTNLHEKPWQEIYDMLKKELGLSPQSPEGNVNE